MTKPKPVTLVTGGSAGTREAEIAATIIADSTMVISNPSFTIAIILEGMSDGIDSFAGIANNSLFLTIVRIAPGCPCCIGNLTMRVTLNRLLRHPPDKLYISLAAHSHVSQVRAFLMQHPYDKLLTFTKDIHV
jgi:G3E family GTPase